MKKFLIGSVCFLLVFFLVACGKDKAKEEGNKIELTEEEKLPDDQVVVIVNDTEINGAIYNSMYLQLKTIVTKPDGEVDKVQLKNATIDAIVDKELFMQLAKKDGIERSEEHTSELQSRGHLVCRLLLE